MRRRPGWGWWNAPNTSCSSLSMSSTKRKVSAGGGRTGSRVWTGRSADNRRSLPESGETGADCRCINTRGALQGPWYLSSGKLATHWLLGLVLESFQ